MFTPLEWIVLVFALVAILKAIFVLGNRKAWMKILDALYGSHSMVSSLFLVLAAVILYYLVQEISIVQILAAAAFTACLMALAFVQYGRETKQFAKKMIATPLKGMIWVYILIWFVLLAWAVWEILA